jgi:epimerase EvaD
MQARPLAVAGAFEFSPDIHADHRGRFVSPYQEPVFADAVGAPLFAVAQTNLSLSQRGVVRGIHFTTTPPGSAKYVYCPHGRALDLVVDIRTGSPTYGRWDAVVLDAETSRACYLPVGVGHAFVALEDATVMSYLMSASYDPAVERALAVLDDAIGLPIPRHLDPVLSDRDREAPTLAEAEAAGILPTYERCRQVEAGAAGRA